MLAVKQGELDFEDRTTYFVEIVLPLAISGTYTYRVPHALVPSLELGKRVVVQFGKTKLYSGLIHRIHQTVPERYEAKYILEILDSTPVVTSTQYELWEWISEYYLCTLGEVMQAAMPSALKLASETKIIAGDLTQIEKHELTDYEFLIVDALELTKEISVSDVVQLLGIKSVFPILKKMFDNGLIKISEKLDERYTPKKVTYVKLKENFYIETEKKALFEGLSRAPKQQDVLLAYYQLEKTGKPITKKELLKYAEGGDSALTALVKKGILETYKEQVSRLTYAEEEIVPSPT